MPSSRQRIGILALSVSALLPTAAAAKSDNPSHDLLVALPPNLQATFLAALNPDGGCVGVSAFFRGMGKDNAAYWSVRCKNGESYQIEMKPDGTNRGLDCSTAKIIGIDCFKAF